jgi:hypothetical protein
MPIDYLLQIWQLAWPCGKNFFTLIFISIVIIIIITIIITFVILIFCTLPIFFFFTFLLLVIRKLYIWVVDSLACTVTKLGLFSNFVFSVLKLRRTLLPWFHFPFSLKVSVFFLEILLFSVTASYWSFKPLWQNFFGWLSESPIKL